MAAEANPAVALSPRGRSSKSSRAWAARQEIETEKQAEARKKADARAQVQLAKDIRELTGKYKEKTKDVPLSPIVHSPRKAAPVNPLRFDPNVTIASPDAEAAARQGAAPAGAAAAATATALLWLGTTPFPAAAAALAAAPLELLNTAGRGALVNCLVSYAAMILAYIGGIQQATALHADAATGSAWPLVVAGIGVREQSQIHYSGTFAHRQRSGC
jgi:hypothetical protein